ncbi:MAG: bifunctional glutamate N-acetyltransferase/amino-acid acetyltransferase ArgJ [Thermoplasmatota archaeon]
MSPQLLAPTGLQVQGFRSMGVATGVKNGRPDLALIVSDVPGTVGAAVFTQNAFAAAPVHLGRQHVADGHLQAIVINAGNANACTGRQGLRDALQMSQTTGDALGIAKEQVLVCSTGIIGRPMPMDKILPGITQCAQRLDEGTGQEAAHAILTTDSGPKQALRRFTANGHEYTIAGIAKGAGMIHPNMATMLGFLVTDAPVARRAIQPALQQAVDMSFNQISVDGDESTNDTCAILANGAAAGPTLEPGQPGWDAFMTTLQSICVDLAKRIPADGEGATRLLTCHVEGAQDDPTARQLARAVVSSTLVKAALHGADPNWGRVLAALGQTQRDLPASIDLHVESNLGRHALLIDGEPQDLGPAHEVLQAPEVTFQLRVGDGNGSGTAWGCDITEDYVTFNAEYST